VYGLESSKNSEFSAIHDAVMGLDLATKGDAFSKVNSSEKISRLVNMARSRYVSVKKTRTAAGLISVGEPEQVAAVNALLDLINSVEPIIADAEENARFLQDAQARCDAYLDELHKAEEQIVYKLYCIDQQGAYRLLESEEYRKWRDVKYAEAHMYFQTYQDVCELQAADAGYNASIADMNSLIIARNALMTELLAVRDDIAAVEPPTLATLGLA
jgi:hypothetical protein